MSLEKIMVLKIGGSLLNPKIFPSLVKGLAAYLKKHRTVLVHGGGKEITDFSARLGLRSRFVKGRRFTDQKTMEIVEMVLCGKVNPSLVSALSKNGIEALGLSGRDADLIRAKRISFLGYVGIPDRIRTNRIIALLSKGFLPVFASVAARRNGGSLNVNADEMASAIAVALHAERLILFTDVPGILDSTGKTIPNISLKEGGSLIQSKTVSEGMIPKLNSALNALKCGVQEIWILQGKLPLSRAKGTVLTRNTAQPKQPFS